MFFDVDAYEKFLMSKEEVALLEDAEKKDKDSEKKDEKAKDSKKKGKTADEERSQIAMLLANEPDREALERDVLRMPAWMRRMVKGLM